MKAGSRASTTAGFLAGVLSGAVIGYFIFGSGDQAPAMAPETIALVNGSPVREGDFQARLDAAVSMHTATGSAHEAVLQAMVDEQLLAQHTIATGLVHRDATLASAIRSAVAGAFLQGATEGEPSDAQLEAFYAEQGVLFREPARFAVQRMVFRGDGALKLAEHAHAQLVAGAEFDSVRAQFANPDLMGLPETLLEADRLAQSLGEVLTDAVIKLPRGAFTEPLSAEGGYVILGVKDNQPPRKPPLATIRGQVAEHYRAHLREQALEKLVSGLRDKAEIEFNGLLNESGVR